MPSSWLIASDLLNSGQSGAQKGQDARFRYLVNFSHSLQVNSRQRFFHSNLDVATENKVCFFSIDFCHEKFMGVFEVSIPKKMFVLKGVFKVSGK